MPAVGDQIGAYRLVQKLGEGGMGQVFRAEHRHIAREAAVKVLLPELSTQPEVIERFFAEARAASVIKHPCIVEILDCDVANTGAAFIVMELLEGEDLESYLGKHASSPLTLDFVAYVGAQVSSALAAAHAAGIIHRDLKPANVFLAGGQADDRPHIKLLDFGIAKLAAGKVPSKVKTRTGSLLGTPVYMSPEQCRGAGEIDHRSDIYSLGCVLFELLAGRPPFVREGAGELIAAHIGESPPRLSEVSPEAPPPLDQLVAEMLEKDPAKRPTSMLVVESRLRALSPRQTAVLPPNASVSELRSPAPAAPLAVTVGATKPLPASAPKTTFHDSASELLRVADDKPTPRRTTLLLFAGGVVVAAAAVGLVRVVASRRQPSRTADVAPSAAATSVRPQPLATDTSTIQESTAAAPDVGISVTSTPPGAAVFIADEKATRGVTPMQLKLPRQGAPVAVRIQLTGFEPRVLSVVPDRERELDLELTPMRTATTPKRVHPHRREDPGYMKLKD